MMVLNMAFSGLVCQRRHVHPAIFSLVFLFLYAANVPRTAGLYLNCGGDVTNERGVIQSPNFPHPFPDPISCTWILRAPPGKRIHLRFTQYFLREAFLLAEFDTYTSPTVFTGRSDLGVVDFREHIRSVVGHKPVLSIEFRSWGKKNIHLRVEEFLTDVYGFNLTYEMEDVAEPLRDNSCSVSGCSFLGHCYVSGDWSQYYCDCFPGYYGSECRYGPHCDPETGRNMCLNGGACRYFYGSYVNMCLCPPDFTGVQCETAINDTWVSTPDEECDNLSCSQLCEKRPGTNQVFCSCEQGFRLSADNVTCQLIEMHRVTVDLYTADTYYTPEDVLSQSYRARGLRQLNMLLRLYRLPTAERFNIDSFRTPAENPHLWILRFHFYTDSGNKHQVQQMFYLIGLRGRLFNLTLTYSYLHIHISPELRHLGVENYEGRAAPEGSFSNLVCRARGSNLMQFRWYKDGRVVNTSLTIRNVWNTRIVESDGQTLMSILNINDITIYDKGVFTCEVEDFGDVQRQSVELSVVMFPSIIITPRAANVRKGEPVSFRCFSPDERLRKYSYSWRKNGLALKYREDMETEEDVQPRGKRLIVPKAQQPANYTCVVTTHVISASSTVRMFVSDTSEKCQKSRARGITWEPAVHEGFDMQKCPNPMHGLASRKCRCNPGNCTWSPPNFARCQTRAFITVFDKTEELRLGYQEQALTNIFAELLSLLKYISADDMIPGDVTLASRIILNAMMTAVDIPDFLAQTTTTKLYPEQPLQLLSLLMFFATKATAEEKAEQNVLARSFLTMEILSELMENFIPQLRNGSFRDPGLVAEIKEYKNYVLQIQPAEAGVLPSEQSLATNSLQSFSLISSKEFADAFPTENPDSPIQSSTKSDKKDSTYGGNPVSASVGPDFHNSSSEHEVELTRKASKSNGNGITPASGLLESATVNEDVRASESVTGMGRKERIYTAEGGAREEQGSRRERGQTVAAKESEPEYMMENGARTSVPDESGFTLQNMTNRSEHWMEGGRQNASLHVFTKLQTGGEYYVAAESFQVLEIVHTESLELVDFPQREDSKQSHWLSLTHMRSVLPIGGLWSSERFLTKLTFYHNMSRPMFEQNETACFALTTYSHTLEQQWTRSPCQVLASGMNFTVCLCVLPVHVAVFIRTDLLVEQNVSSRSVGSLVLLMGCITALCGVSAVLLCYLLAYRSITSVYHIIRLNTVLALAVLLVLCITCLQGRHLAILCLTGRLLLHLTLLATFCFLFVDALHMYLVIHSASPRVLAERRWKFLAIGWVIPVLSVGSTAAMSSRYGYNNECHAWCWVEPSSWHFFPFLVPLLMFVVASVLISAKCVWTVYSWTDEWRYRARKKQLFRISKNGAILLFLLGVTWSGCYVDSDQGYGTQVVFVCLLFILVVVLFTSYCVTDRTVTRALSVIFRHRRRRLRENRSSHSFRAFIMPEKITDEGEQGERRDTEEQNIHRLCAERDNKYTSAKKRELRFLLGSTSSSSQSSGESDPLRTSSGTSGHHRHRRPRHLYTSVGVIVHPGRGENRGGKAEKMGEGEEEEEEEEEEEAPVDLKTDSGISVEEGDSEKSLSVGEQAPSCSSASSRSADFRFALVPGNTEEDEVMEASNVGVEPQSRI